MVLEDSEISGEEPSQDQEPQPRTRNAAASSPTKPTPKGTMMEVGTGKRLRSKGTAGPATADKPAEAQPAAEEEQGHQQPEAAVKRKRGRPPGSLNKRAGAALPLTLHFAGHGNKLDMLGNYGGTHRE